MRRFLSTEANSFMTSSQSKNFDADSLSMDKIARSDNLSSPMVVLNLLLNEEKDRSHSALVYSESYLNCLKEILICRLARVKVNSKLSY